MEFFLFPIIGFAIFAIVSSTVMMAKRKSAAEQMKNANEQKTGQPAQVNASVRPPVRNKYTPVKTSVNTKPDRTPAGKSVQEELHPNESVSVNKTQNGIALNFTGNDVVKGILYAEILGKPKALQKQ